MNLSDLTELFSPEISHRIARALGMELVLAIFCRHCPAAWIDWPNEDEEVEEAAAWAPTAH